MSLFPRRTRRGESVTVHVRRLMLPRGTAGFVDYTLVVRDPNGETVHRAERTLACLPPAIGDRDALAQERFSFAPLMLNCARGDGEVTVADAEGYSLFGLLAGARARGNDESPQFERVAATLQDMVAEYSSAQSLTKLPIEFALMRASSHFYFTVPVANDAAVGRHTVEVTAVGGAPLEAPPVVLEESFVVDEPRLESFTMSDGVGVATVFNPSSVELPVRVAEVDGDAIDVRRVVLAPNATTEILLLRGYGLLLYAEGVGVVPLASPATEFLQRHVRWRERLPDAEAPQPLLGVLSAATGLLPRRELERRFSVAAVAEAVALGLIVPVDRSRA